MPWHLQLFCLGLGSPPCPESCYDPSLVLCPDLTESPYLVDKVLETFENSFACLHGHCCCAYCEQAIHFCERAKHEHCWGPSCVQTAPSCVFHSTAHRVHSELPPDPKGELHSARKLHQQMGQRKNVCWALRAMTRHAGGVSQRNAKGKV